MLLIYRFTPSSGTGPLGNAPPDCAACIANCQADNELHACGYFREVRRRGIREDKNGILYVCTSDAVRSTRLFREKQRVLSQLLPELDALRARMRASDAGVLNRVGHNLLTLNAQSLQAIYTLIPQEQFLQRDRDALLSAIAESIKSAPQAAADLVLRLIQNENLVKTEFSVYRKLFAREPVEKSHHEVHRVLLLVLNGFWNDFSEKGIKLDIGECYERGYVDYDTTAALFVHVLGNAAKYILPGSTLGISFAVVREEIRIAFGMQSLRVRKEETERIFEDGYSGKLPRELGLAGSGIGLHTVRELARLNGGRVRFVADDDPARRSIYRGISFEYNIMEVFLPRSR